MRKKEKKLARIKHKLELKEESLKRELRLQDTSSPFFIEMIAREKLRMAKKDEYIYFIVHHGKNEKKQ